MTDKQEEQRVVVDGTMADMNRTAAAVKLRRKYVKKGERTQMMKSSSRR